MVVQPSRRAGPGLSVPADSLVRCRAELLSQLSSFVKGRCFTLYSPDISLVISSSLPALSCLMLLCQPSGTEILFSSPKARFAVK